MPQELTCRTGCGCLPAWWEGGEDLGEEDVEDEGWDGYKLSMSPGSSEGPLLKIWNKKNQDENCN